MINKKIQAVLAALLAVFIFQNKIYPSPQEINYSLRIPLSFNDPANNRTAEFLNVLTAEQGFIETKRGLKEISQNLWFEWNYKAKELFRSIDPELWGRKNVAENPALFLSHLEDAKLKAWRYEGWVGLLLGEFKIGTDDNPGRDFRIDQEQDLKLEARLRPIIYFGKSFTWPEKRKEFGAVKIQPNVAEPEKFTRPLMLKLAPDAAKTAL